MKLIMEFDNLEPISVNDAYRPTVSAPDKNGKRHGFLRSSNELMSFQDKFDSMLSDYNDKIKEFINKCKKNYNNLGFKVIFLIGMPHDSLYYIRKPNDLRPHDASNYIKAAEDRLAIALEVDDKYTMDVRSVKYLSDVENWILSIIIEPVDFTVYTRDYIKEEFLNETIKTENFL